MNRRRWAVLALLLAVGLAAPACDRPSARTAGRLTVEGNAEVVSLDGDKHEVTRSRTLKSGEQVRVLDGTAMLGLGSGRQLELRKGSTVRLAVQQSATGQTETRGELLSGAVLAIAPDDAASVVAADSTIQVTGIARLSRDLAVVVAVYQGAAGVETAGRAVSVPALRQVTVPAPGLPSRATPITFQNDDSWDQRYLGDAVDLGNQLAARSKGFSAQVGAARSTDVAFFRQILPGLADQPFDTALLTADRAPGETLVGAAITLAGTKGQFPDRWASVFAFHNLGATWGLVALDQGVARGPLMAELDAAIGRVTPIGSTGNQAAPAPVQVRPPVTSPPPNTGSQAAPTTPSPTPTTVPASSGGGSTGTPAQTTPPPQPPPGSSIDGNQGPLNTGVPLLDETVRAVVDALTGLLRELGPG